MTTGNLWRESNLPRHRYNVDQFFFVLSLQRFHLRTQLFQCLLGQQFFRLREHLGFFLLDVVRHQLLDHVH